MTGKTNLKMWLTICSLMLVVVSAAGAETHYVNPWDSIQAAINAAVSGDQIEVATGTYRETINFNGKAVRLYASSGPQWTFIDGGGAYHVVQCVSGEGPGTILEGFTITGGNANGAGIDKSGGGMLNTNGSSPTVKNCQFDNNRATWGGGMYNDPECNPTVTDCRFTANSATANGGGGGMLNWSSPMVTRCEFSGNHAEVAGAGIYNYNNSAPTIIDCRFRYNSAGYGGGMYNQLSGPTVTSCFFTVNNAHHDGGGMYNQLSGPTVTSCFFTDNEASNDGGGMYNQFSSPTVTHCNFMGNESTYGGGGMYNYNNSTPTVSDCNFIENSAHYTGGGGMCNSHYSRPSVTRCNFKRNRSPYYGGGMRNTEWSGASVSHCLFEGNHASQAGGGIDNSNSALTLTNCTFNRNHTAGLLGERGGGMSSSHGSILTLTNCYFNRNESWWGGGMFTEDSSAMATNCVFNANQAWVFTSPGKGGGIYNKNSSLRLTNCTLIANWTDKEIDILFGFGGGMYNEGDSATVTNCIFWNNYSYWGTEIWGPATVTYSDVEGVVVWPGTGNINLNPMFADPDGRLSPGSPCVDVGNNAAVPADVTTDLDGNPRIVNDTVDMGAYEYQAKPIHNTTQDLWYETIQSAIDAADDHDEIKVGPRTYYEAIDFKGKAIRLYSGGGPELTTIDGTGKGYHVVQCVNGEGPGTILEGFTITGGNADGEGSGNRGGGMYNNNSRPTVINCIFTGNTATGHGGGMSNNASSPNVTGCTFTNNSAGGRGGAMYVYEWSTPSVTDCTFSGNQAVAGGAGLAISWYCAATISGCTFSGNTVTGGRYDGGALHLAFDFGTTVTNCTFTGNSAANGGAMCNGNHIRVYDENYPSAPATKLTNCTFIDNSAVTGGAMYNVQSGPEIVNCTFSDNDSPSISTQYGGEVPKMVPTVTNCILWGDLPNQIVDTPSEVSTIVTYSDVQGGYDGTGNIDLDPLFEDAKGRLSWNSPCIDAGDNDAVSADITTDLQGNPRFADFPGIVDTGSGTPPIVDMGAYEWPDADADGIVDSIDFARDVYSNDFLAWLPFRGRIVDRADQVVVVTRGAPGFYGVKIKASGGTEQARVDFLYLWGWKVCSIMLDAGDEVGVGSGSIDIAAVQGTVEMFFVADDGTEAQTSLNADNSIEFEPETCAFTAPETNTEPVVVTVDGGEIIVAPGQSKLLAMVDIDPETLNLKSEGTGVTCYIELPAGFDVGQIDVSTLRLNGQVPAEPEPTEVGDYDSDGRADLMVKFDRAATHTTVEVGDVVHISVGGQLNDGTEFEGCDVVRVIAPGR